MNHQFARRLRKNMTDAEQHLGQRLRYCQVGEYKFRRQAPIGIYVVDFVCFERKLIVELGGGQHAEQETKDVERTRWLNRQGFQVLRFWNHEIFEDTDWVLELIAESLQGATPHPNPPPQGGRE
jgi:very-short-patch-repair endonuclease